MCYNINEMKKRIFKTICLILIAATVLVSGFNVEKIQKANAWAPELYPNYVIDDARFVDINSMSAGDIQRFFEQRGSELKDFSENGRSAAQIIYDAAHGHGEASGDWNGISVHDTVSPKVIIVTLQKEQGLITNNYAYQDKQRAYDCAMGYESGQGCRWMFENRQQWKGFTNQVEYAAWQLRYNYEGSTRNTFSDYQVGQYMTFSDQVVHLDNRATAALYRYTPNIQSSFHNIYYEYFGNLVGDIQELNADVHWEKPVDVGSLKPGETFRAKVEYRNVGSRSWKKEEVFLGTKDPLDRKSIFNTGNGWIANDKNRIQMNENEVRTGDLATFEFDFKAPSERPIQTTTYLECFKPVKDYGEKTGWFHNDDQVCWRIPVAGIDQTYHYSYVNQSPSGPDYVTLLPGRSTTFNLTVKNTGESTWTRDTVRLGTDKFRDRIPFYTLGSGWTGNNKNRIQMQEESVAPGSDAHFSFNLTLPENTAGGTYREYFRLVADGIGWMEDYGIYYDIKVPSAQERYSYKWISQNNPDTAGEEAIILYRRQIKEFMLTIQNTGLETWTKDKVFLGTSRNRDRVSSFNRYSGWSSNSNNRIPMNENSVAPNGYATFSFSIEVPENISGGEYKEYFQPVADGIAWMQDYGVYWRIKIP